MFKCWNCGTEHEGSDEASYNRGWNAALQSLMHKMQNLPMHTFDDDPTNTLVLLFDMDDMILGQMK